MKLALRLSYLIEYYQTHLESNNLEGNEIKWSRNLKRRFTQGKSEQYSNNRIQRAFYRPFISCYVYDSNLFIDERGSVSSIFQKAADNFSICTIGDATDKPFSVLSTNRFTDLNFLSPAAAGSKIFPTACL
ncbi:MAG: hypothetical protein HC889_05015 [Synechococcaceae cyanobacterium SM1_2_3]|nr:hypothetical protein [Synechococcaceae cyanobacterium SM1_2_3]